jgi:hypothetical protein
MLRNVCRGVAGAILAASLVGCGGDEGTTIPTTTAPLSPEMQDFKAQLDQKQKDRMAHARSGSNVFANRRRH